MVKETELINTFVKSRYFISKDVIDDENFNISGKEIIQLISDYIKQMKGPVSVNWQLCPKCQGEGMLSNIGTSTSVNRVCDVCNGNKIITPIILPNQ